MDGDLMKGFNQPKPALPSDQSGIPAGPELAKAPSAFIKDKETLEYLVKKWNDYAVHNGRDYKGEFFIDKTYYTEVYKGDPLRESLNDSSPGYYEAQRRYTLVNNEVPGLFKESAERMHGVNFFNEVQETLDGKRTKNDKKPVRVLVTGGDVGFLNDELRSKFGKDIDVVGTTVEVSRAQRRKRYFVELIRNGKIKLPPKVEEYLSKSLSDKLDPRDTKWRSILQMQSSAPEFDKIIDTCGELLYSRDEKKPEIFEMTFKACIAKLNLGGKLYIAELDSAASKFAEAYCKENNLILARGEYVNRHDNPANNYIITKPEQV